MVVMLLCSCRWQMFWWPLSNLLLSFIRGIDGRHKALAVVCRSHQGDFSENGDLPETVGLENKIRVSLCE